LAVVAEHASALMNFGSMMAADVMAGAHDAKAGLFVEAQGRLWCSRG
jgi:hypothetical protein